MLHHPDNQMVRHSQNEDVSLVLLRVINTQNSPSLLPWLKIFAKETLGLEPDIGSIEKSFWEIEFSGLERVKFSG